MQHKVKILQDGACLYHSGEIGTEYACDKNMIYLQFDDGDKRGYYPVMLETLLPESGIIPKEQSIMDDIVSAWNKFIKLEKQHPCDINEFGDAIHRLQGILAMRPLRRQYPDYWKSYKE